MKDGATVEWRVVWRVQSDFTGETFMVEAPSETMARTYAQMHPRDVSTRFQMDRGYVVKSVEIQSRIIGPWLTGERTADVSTA